MAEALYNASRLGLPIVMTVANRAIGAPINIWNDHSDAMSQRELQLYAEDDQAATDLLAFRLAEELSTPPAAQKTTGLGMPEGHERARCPALEAGRGRPGGRAEFRHRHRRCLPQPPPGVDVVAAGELAAGSSGSWQGGFGALAGQALVARRCRNRRRTRAG
ncbi:hypothetical protein [Phytohabitans houttuyneae]|uniref:hypothetical protein n=1 Tax=Phytohabitans houttuyneae TaxID=1076126 RepID=UPI0035309261